METNPPLIRLMIGIVSRYLNRRLLRRSLFRDRAVPFGAWERNFKPADRPVREASAFRSLFPVAAVSNPL